MLSRRPLYTAAFLILIGELFFSESLSLPSLDSGELPLDFQLPVPAFQPESVILPDLTLNDELSELPVPPDFETPRPVKVFDSAEEESVQEHETVFSESSDESASPDINVIKAARDRNNLSDKEIPVVKIISPDKEIPVAKAKPLANAENASVSHEKNNSKIIQNKESGEESAKNEMSKPENLTRLVSAYSQKDVELTLDGRGWVLLPGEAADNAFIRKEYTEDSTMFVFFFSETGSFKVKLEQYSLSSPGISASLDVEFLVSESIKVPPQSVEKTKEETELPLEEISVREKADQALRQGNNEQAVIFYRQAYLEDNEKENLQTAFEAASDGFLFLVISDLIEDWLSLIKPQQDKATEVLQALENEMGYEDEIKLLKGYIKVANDPVDSDSPEALLEAARKWESPGENRDYRKAYEIYNDILKRFPFSREAIEARKRRDYLDRHFFRIN